MKKHFELILAVFNDQEAREMIADLFANEIHRLFEELECNAGAEDQIFSEVADTDRVVSGLGLTANVEHLLSVRGLMSPLNAIAG